MYRKSLFIAVLIAFISIISAGPAAASLPYKTIDAHNGREIPRTRTISYNTEQDALSGNIENSTYIQILDGKLSRRDDSGFTVFSAEYKVPFAWVDRQYFLHVGIAAAEYYIYANGNEVGYNRSNATEAEFDLTVFSNEGMNTLEIRVAKNSETKALSKASLPDVPLDVYIVSQPRVRIRDFTLSSYFNGPDAIAELGVIVKSHFLNDKTVRIHYSLLDSNGEQTATGYRDASFSMRGEDTVRFLIESPLRRWSHETPNRYKLLLKLQNEGRYNEYIAYDIAFRTVESADGKLLINSHPVVLSATEYSSYADYALMLNELQDIKNSGYNCIRIAAAPLPYYFYSICDDLGLYVCDQADIDSRSFGDSRTVGGNPSNDPSWSENYSDRALTAWFNHRNHPSVLMLSLARNSSNGYNLYESYRTLKSADPRALVIYTDAGGEWNTDAVSHETVRINPDQQGKRFVFGISSVPANITSVGSYISFSVEDNAGGKILVNNASTVSFFHGEVVYTVKQGNKKIASGALPLSIDAGESKQVIVPTTGAKPGKTLKYELQFNEH